MILLISIKTIQDSEIVPLYEKLPIDLRNNIDRIYCVAKPEIVKEASPNKVIIKKPTSYFSNEDSALEMLTQNLYFNKIIVHARNVDRYIYSIIKNLKDFDIYIGKTRKALPKYIDDKELFLAVYTELSKIDFVHHDHYSVNEEYQSIIEERNKVFPRKQIEDSILNKEKSSIIQFDQYVNKTKIFNKINILGKIPVLKILYNAKQILKEDLLINKRIIELWIGIEHLSAKELNSLIFMMKNNNNSNILYRLIVHGPIPQALIKQNLKVISFQIKHFFQQLDKTNISTQFYFQLLKALLSVSGKSTIYNYRELLEQDTFKPLIFFPSGGHLKSAILNSIATKEELLEKPFQLNDNYFWYQLNNYFINIPRSKKHLKHFKLKSSGKLSEILSSRITGQIVKITKNEQLELDSELPNKLRLQREKITKTYSKEKIRKWFVYYNNKKIGEERLDSRFVQVLEVLFNNYQSNVVIDAKKLAEIIYESAEEKPNKTGEKEIKFPEKTFRQLRYDFQNKYKILGNIAKHFVFTSEECYYDPRGKLKLLVEKE